MTPKEKAEELVKKMFNVDLECENEAMCMLYPHAVRCALIAVDEIINYLEVDGFSTQIKYWQEVKQEIEKL